MCYLPDWQCLERKQNFHSRVWSLSVKVITVSLNTKENPLKSLHWNVISEEKKNIQWSSLRNWNISCPDLGQDQASSLNEGLVFIVNSKEFASNLYPFRFFYLDDHWYPQWENPFCPNCIPGSFWTLSQPFNDPSQPFRGLSWPFCCPFPALSRPFCGPFAVFCGLFTALSWPFCSLFAALARPFSKRRREPGTSFFGKVLWTCSTKAFLMQQGAAAVV